MLSIRPKASAKPESSSPQGPGGLPRMVNSAGRIGLSLLQRMVQAASSDDFIHFMQKPVLAGSAIHLGTLAAQTDHGSREMNRTVLFEPVADGEEAVSASESLKLAIYPLIKGEYATSTREVFSIGRIDGNDFIMPDYAISKKHALIEIKRDGYFLKDCGSTNGTLLNGVRLQNKPAEVHDRDVISFARYEFAFLFPGSLYEMLRQG
jgi:FHA domain